MAEFILSPLFTNFKITDNRGRLITIQPAKYVGKKFNRLLAVAHAGGERAQKSEQRSRYVWLCDCGNFVITTCDVVVKGKTKSCGCWKKENAGKHCVTHGAARVGLRWSEYSVWATMHARCKNTKDTSYPYYGGRGIKVHEDFKTFEGFIKHMGRSNGLTLERFDVNGDYAPGNVGWATRLEQAANKRNSVHVIFNNKKYCLEQAIRFAKKDRETYFVLRKQGFTPQEAFDCAPVRLKYSMEQRQ